jgi:hypothetical protein
MAKAPHDDALSAAGMAAMSAMDPEMARQICNKTMAQFREMNQICYSAMTRAMESNWDYYARLMQCSDVYEAAMLTRSWANERRDAMLAEGRNISSMMFKAGQMDGVSAATSTRSPASVSPMQRAAAGE